MGFSIPTFFRKLTHWGAEEVAPPAPPAPAPAATTFSRSRNDAGIKGIVDKLEGLVEKHFLTSHDGFAAFDPASKAITTGVNPSAVDHDMPRYNFLNSLATILAGHEHDQPISFSYKGLTIDGAPTGKEAELAVGLSGAIGAAIVKDVDPKRGGLAEVSVESKEGTDPATARVLMLPANYDGPIFVSDIDDTLRPTDVGKVLGGETQAPIPGAKEILEGVTNLGVPIVYLSAGTTRIHGANESFLAQLPKGILLDNQDWKPNTDDLDNTKSAHNQAAYKLSVLLKLKATYPQAQIFGLGDDKYGDAIAYTKAGAKAYIHDVYPDDHNIPSDFSGTKTLTYSEDFRATLLGDLSSARGASQAFKDSP